MPQCFAQGVQAKRLARDVGVQSQREDERLVLGLADHHVELVHDHVGEFAGAMAAMQERGDIVQLDRVGDRQQRARARAHPERLIVGRPVEYVVVARLFQEIDGDACFPETRTQPAGRRGAALIRDCARHFANEVRFVVLPHVVLHLGTRPAVRDDFAPACVQARDEFGTLAIEQSVDGTGQGELQFIEHREQVPEAHPLPVIAPPEIALGLRCAGRRNVVGDAGAEGEVLDADRGVKRQSRAPGPTVVGPPADGGKRIAAMFWKLHRQLPGTMPAGSAAQCSAIWPGSVNQTRSFLG